MLMPLLSNRTSAKSGFEAAQAPSARSPFAKSRPLRSTGLYGSGFFSASSGTRSCSGSGSTRCARTALAS